MTLVLFGTLYGGGEDAEAQAVAACRELETALRKAGFSGVVEVRNVRSGQTVHQATFTTTAR